MASAVRGRLLRRSMHVLVVVFRTINEIIFGNSPLNVQEFGWFQKGHFFSSEPNYRSVIRCGISGANGGLPHVHSQTRRAFPFETDHRFFLQDWKSKHTLNITNLSNLG
jgi:hypothetical protein